MNKVIHKPVVGKGDKTPLPFSPSFLNEAEGIPERNPADESISTDLKPEGNLELVKLQSDLEKSQNQTLQAESKLRELQENIESLRREAKKEGYEQGKVQARNENALELENQKQEIQNCVNDFRKQWHQLRDIAEDAALEIALCATSKILGSLGQDTRLLESFIRNAVNQLIDKDGLVIYLSPKDHLRMEQVARTNRRDWADMEFKADPALGVGDSKIVSRNGTLDIRLENILASLKDTLLIEREKPIVRSPGNGIARPEIN
ncbi:MAG: hypothetical protein JXR18_12440 [Neptuniibacter sp.]